MMPEAGSTEGARGAVGLKKMRVGGFMGEAGWNGACVGKWDRLLTAQHL